MKDYKPKMVLLRDREVRGWRGGDWERHRRAVLRRASGSLRAGRRRSGEPRHSRWSCSFLWDQWLQVRLWSFFVLWLPVQRSSGQPSCPSTLTFRAFFFSFFVVLLFSQNEWILQVLDALGERIPCASYDSWMVYVPEGEFLSRIGPTDFFKVSFFLLFS